jgi:hypothetical protein
MDDVPGVKEGEGTQLSQQCEPNLYVMNTSAKARFMVSQG